MMKAAGVLRTEMTVKPSESRSRNMAAIRGRDTKPEILLRKLLHRHGFRFRKNVRGLPGTPDIVLRRHNAIVRVHGCFWHQHSRCKYAVMPKTRIEFWTEKFDENRLRDQRNLEALHALGWRVLTVWECSLKDRDEEGQEILINRVSEWLLGDEDSLELRGPHEDT